jgi:uncharacterized membrane protein
VLLSDLLLAFLLGFVSGLRTFTAPAVLWLMRHRGPLAYVLVAAAAFEYFFDVNPKAPPRTAPFGLICRLISGAFVGYWAGVATSIAPVYGAAVGAIGAIVGAYVSLPVRRWAIAKIGDPPAGMLEDVVAIVASVVIVAAL